MVFRNTLSVFSVCHLISELGYYSNALIIKIHRMSCFDVAVSLFSEIFNYLYLINSLQIYSMIHEMYALNFILTWSQVMEISIFNFNYGIPIR